MYSNKLLVLLSALLHQATASQCDDIVNGAITELANKDSGYETLSTVFPAQCLEEIPKVNEGVQYKSTFADYRLNTFCSAKVDGFDTVTVSYTNDKSLTYDPIALSLNMTSAITPLLYDKEGKNACQSHLIYQPVGNENFALLVQTDDTSGPICDVPFEETEMAGAVESVIGRVLENHKTSFCVILDSETSNFRVTIRGKYSLSDMFESVGDITCYSVNSPPFEEVDDCVR